MGVVRHLCEQKTFDGITEQDQLKLVQEAESDPKEPTLSPNLFIARARLLLLLTWCIDESKRRFSVNSIYSKCLQLRNQAVRLFALEHLNRKELQLSVSDVEAICPIVVSLLRDETSEDVLAQVSCVCMHACIVVVVVTAYRCKPWDLFTFHRPTRSWLVLLKLLAPNV